MRCSNRKLLIVFEGSAQRERTIDNGIHIMLDLYWMITRSLKSGKRPAIYTRTRDLLYIPGPETC